MCGNMEPIMDLGPSAGFSYQDIQRMTLDNEPSAAAKAGSTADVRFVTNNPLSELVWSTHNGLSIKCADFSLAEKKPSLLQGAGPDNMAASAVQNSPPLQVGAARPNDETERVTMSMFPRSGAHSSNADHSVNRGIVGQTKTMMLESVILLNRHSVGDVKDGTSQLNRWKTESISNSGGKYGQEGGRSIYSSEFRIQQKSQMDALSDDFNRVINSDPFGRAEDTSIPCKRNNESALSIEEYRSHKLMPLLSNAPLEKLECTAENDLLPSNIENAGGAVNWGIEALDSFNDVKNNSQDHPPYISKAQIYGIKDKGKAIFDGYVNERISKDESCESADSCSSAGSSVTGKKRLNPEQKLTFDSKRFKKQAEEDSAPSTSFVRHESSFMNWISNMVNGLSKSNQDATLSCPLGVPDPNHGSEKQDQKLVTYVRNQDTECKVGFRTMFQSLYRPNTWVQRTEAFCGESSSFHNQCALPNEKFNQIRCSDIECLPTQRINPSPNVSAFQKICHTDSGNLLNPACSTKKDGDGMSLLTSSLGKRKANNADNINFFPPTKGKASANHGSLWITRLASKASGSIVNVGHRSRSLENSTDCAMSLPFDHDAFQEHKTFEFTDNSRRSPSSDGGTDSRNHVPIPESFFCLERLKGPEDRKFECRVESVDPSLTSVCFKSSEAIASVAAGRVDALKHARQSDGTNNAARKMKICFFCGSQGHNLQDCSEITDSELGGLLRNVKAYDVVDESHGLCIRCFQLNHWAIACPNASSRCETRQNWSAQSSNEPTSVNAGGMKCLVESQNISNHDFLEEEPMAWWSTQPP